MLAPKELLKPGKEEAQNPYSRANDALRRAVSGKSPAERTELFVRDLVGVEYNEDTTYDQRGRMALPAATAIRVAVLLLIAGGVDKAPVLPATNNRSLRMIANALLSFHVLQPYGESAALRGRWACVGTI